MWNVVPQPRGHLSDPSSWRLEPLNEELLIMMIGPHLDTWPSLTVRLRGARVYESLGLKH